MDNHELEPIIVEIKKLLDEKEYDKVVKICSDEDYIQNKDIQHFMIIALMRAEKYEEALVKVNEFLEKGYSARFESKKIILMDKLYGKEVALEECEKVVGKKDSSVAHCMASILFDLGRYNEALELCEEYKEADGKYRDMFLSLKKKISRYTSPEALLLTKISINRIETKEIESSSLEKWKKYFLIVAYYNRVLKKDKAFFAARKMKTAIFDEVEERRKNATTDEERKAIDDFDMSKRQLASDTYNLLLPQKFRPIPMSFFEEGLDCKINPTYAEELRNMKSEKKEKHSKHQKKANKQEIKVEVKEEKKEEPKVEIKPEVKQEEIQVEKKPEEKKIISSYGVVVNNRYNNVNKDSDIDIKNNRDKYENILIKDYYREETIMLGKYLYASTCNLERRGRAIKAYDNFENIVYKPVSDKKALTKFVNLLRKISHAIETDMIILDTTAVELEISIGTVENKYEKAIK